jgi:hypothetical protein
MLKHLQFLANSNWDGFDHEAFNNDLMGNSVSNNLASLLYFLILSPPGWIIQAVIGYYIIKFFSKKNKK